MKNDVKAKNSKGAEEAMKRTAPDAPDPTNMPEGAPNAGVRQLPGKAIPENGADNYRFSTTTAVTAAKEDVGAHARASRLQVGTNLSHLPPAASPEGSQLKDGEKQQYADNLFGTP
jgi:hypothetical protein